MLLASLLTGLSLSIASTLISYKGFVIYTQDMANIKISSKVEEAVWNELKEAAKDSQRDVSDMLTEAISEYLHRRRISPVVQSHIADSIEENEELGHLLAK